jgi:hypothetical protein
MTADSAAGRAAPAEDRLKVRNLTGQVVFDGCTIRLTRLWWPVPGARTRLVPIADVARARVNRPLGDKPSRAGAHFEVWTHGDHGARPHPRWIWAWGLGHRRTRVRFDVMSDVINEAVWERTRLIVRDSVGLGPWPEEVWKQLAALAPDIPGCADHTASYDHRSHRCRVAEALRTMRGERLTWAAASDAPGRPIPSLPSLDAWPRPPMYHWIPGNWGSIDIQDDVWRAFTQQLCADREPTTGPKWAAVAEMLLAWGRRRMATLA